MDQDAGVENVIREIHNDVGTFCPTGSSSGATWPWRMADASKYLSGRSGASLRTDYDGWSLDNDRFKERVIDSIINRRTPAIIGTGWLNHYPMAIAYKLERTITRHCAIFCWDWVSTSEHFYVNNGWGGAGNEWVDAETWFVGELFSPYVSSGGGSSIDKPERGYVGPPSGQKPY